MNRNGKLFHDCTIIKLVLFLFHLSVDGVFDRMCCWL